MYTHTFLPLLSGDCFGSCQGWFSGWIHGRKGWLSNSSLRLDMPRACGQADISVAKTVWLAPLQRRDGDTLWQWIVHDGAGMCVLYISYVALGTSVDNIYYKHHCFSKGKDIHICFLQI